MRCFLWPFVDLHKSIARQSGILCSQVSCVHLKLCVFLVSVVSRIGGLLKMVFSLILQAVLC